MKPEQRRAVPVAESQALRERSEAGVAPGQGCAVPGMRLEDAGPDAPIQNAAGRALKQKQECQGLSSDPVPAAPSLADELQPWVACDDSGGRKLVDAFLLDRILAYLKERQT